MNVPGSPVGGSDAVLEAFAAELTEAAYPIALRHGVKQHWLALELDLWHTLISTVKKWGQHLPQAPQELATWWEDFLAELTDAAYRTTLKYHVQGSFLDVELSLYQTFRLMIESAECASPITQGAITPQRLRRHAANPPNPTRLAADARASL